MEISGFLCWFFVCVEVLLLTLATGWRVLLGMRHDLSCRSEIVGVINKAVPLSKYLPVSKHMDVLLVCSVNEESHKSVKLAVYCLEVA